MISYLKGELAEIKENYVVVEVGNIGYEVSLPTSAIYELPSVAVRLSFILICM